MPATAEAGAAAGLALAEIHARKYPGIGYLGDDLTLVERMPYDDFTPRGYGHAELQNAGAFLGAERSARIAAFLDRDELAARNTLDVPVLSHCDFFKTSNVL